MKSRRTRYAAANPFLAWTAVALKTGEMMWASAQVIGHRTSRIAMAGPDPSARDRREFTRMGQEKLDAATASAQAIAMRMMLIPVQFGTLLLRQTMSGAGSMVALSANPVLALSAKGQAELMRDVIANVTAAATQLSGSAARIAHHGLMPIHSRATANAKRLLKA